MRFVAVDIIDHAGRQYKEPAVDQTALFSRLLYEARYSASIHRKRAITRLRLHGCNSRKSFMIAMKD